MGLQAQRRQRTRVAQLAAVAPVQRRDGRHGVLEVETAPATGEGRGEALLATDDRPGLLARLGMPFRK